MKSRISFLSYLFFSANLCLASCLSADAAASEKKPCDDTNHSHLMSSKQMSSMTSALQADEMKKELDPFKKIRIEGNFKVNLVQGSEHSVLLQGNKENFARLITRVDQDVLTIRTKKLRKNASMLAAEEPLTLNISVSELEKIAVFGCSQINTSQIKAKDLLIEAKGSVEGNFNVDATQIKCKTIGNCDLTLSGHTTDSLLSIDGSGILHAQSLQSENTKVLLRGSGDADINAQNKLNVNIYGSGHVHYTGSPKVHSSLFGSGQVIAMEHAPTDPQHPNVPVGH